MSFRKSLVAAGVMSLAGLISFTFADDEPAEATPAADKAAPADVAKLIQELDGSRFSKRQQASQKLQEAGRAAIPALAEAATGESREASSRAIEILKKHLQAGDEALKAEAQAALEKIAKGNNAQAARAAEQVLNPKKVEPPPQPRIQLRGVPLGQLQIQIQGALGNGKRITMQNVNGVKTIDAQEGNRKVKITDDPNNGIKMEVTETKDGKEETKKYEAKNADELKKNHPDAHKLYEEYSKPAGGIQIGGIQLQPGANPLPEEVFKQLQRGALPNIPGLEIPGMLSAEGQKRVAEKIERAQKQLDDAVEQAKKLAEKSGGADELAKLLAQLEAARKELDEAKAKLAPAK